MTTIAVSHWRMGRAQANKGIGVYGPQATDAMYGVLPLGSLPNDTFPPLVTTGLTFYSASVVQFLASQPLRPGPTLSMKFHHFQTREAPVRRVGSARGAGSPVVSTTSTYIGVVIM